MSTLKIVGGIVLGLFCWNLLTSWHSDWSYEQGRENQQQQLDRAIEVAEKKCDKEATDACTVFLKINYEIFVGTFYV